MKKLLLLASLTLTACVGSIYDAEHWKNATFKLFEGGGCASGEYVLGVDKKDSKQGWKSQREFFCKEGQLAKQYPSLDGKTYTKAEMKALADVLAIIQSSF